MCIRDRNYINTNRITTPEKSRYEVGNTSMRADELQFYLSQLQPVSYTHLDVYKRQAGYCIILTIAFASSIIFLINKIEKAYGLSLIHI